MESYLKVLVHCCPILCIHTLAYLKVILTISYPTVIDIVCHWCKIKGDSSHMWRYLKVYFMSSKFKDIYDSNLVTFIVNLRFGHCVGWVQDLWHNSLSIICGRSMEIHQIGGGYYKKKVWCDMLKVPKFFILSVGISVSFAGNWYNISANRVTKWRIQPRICIIS